MLTPLDSLETNTSKRVIAVQHNEGSYIVDVFALQHVHGLFYVLDKWPPTASGLPSTAGTTASVAFLRKGKLYIGHCGDSGIVLGRTNPKGGKWVAQPLTIEHKPESREELARIESFGGKVQQKQGIHRVVWYRPKNPHQGPIRRNTRIEEVPFLAVARSLGDLWSYNYKTQKFVVSPEPDVAVVEVDTSSFKCLVFASDGLWNVIDPEFSIDSVYETERRNDHNAKLGINTWRNPSRILVETALEKWRSNGLRADNTSVVCVMLDPPNKRNMFKFCRSPTPSEMETPDASRTIYDYSTSEAYNLDYADVYSGGLTRQNAGFDLMPNNQQPFYNTPPFLGPQSNYSSGYNTFDTTYGYQAASTSNEHQALTYQTSSNESAFVKACCRNNYVLANANDQISYHSSYEQHQEMYQNMAMRPYPPLHYAYRPVPTVASQPLPLPSLHANLYEHQGYLQHPPAYKPMERYNYLRPTPEEVAALHNEEDDDSGSDTDVMDFSDEESDDAESQEKPCGENETEKETRDDSVQIFEISSSSFQETVGDDAEFKKKPTKSNNKENTEGSVQKKKSAVTTSGRFYATRQTDRKMRSGNVGVQKSIGKEKLQRRITRNIRKAVKTLSDQKVKTVADTTRAAPKKIVVKNNEDKMKKPRALRSAPTKENDKCSSIVRSLRSNSSSSNVMRTVMKRAATRKQLDNLERSRDRRLK